MQAAATARFPHCATCSTKLSNGGASATRRSYSPQLALSGILIALVVIVLPVLALQYSLASCSDANYCARNLFDQLIFWTTSGGFHITGESHRAYHAEALAAPAAAMANTNLTEILKAAVMQEGPVKKVVIITTVNEAWAGRTSGHENRGGMNSSSSSSMVDVFLESFRWGEGTEALLRHLVMVTLDERAFMRCLDIHPFGHCHRLPGTMGVDFSGEKAFKSADYLAMVWRKVQLLTEVLEQGYSFLFTDADVLWLRNPFPYFLPDTDVQISCDRFNGNPDDVLWNEENTGFMLIRANERTVRLCRHWFNARSSYPQHYHDQDVFNAIKSLSSFTEFGLTLSLLDTQHFGGFCDVGKSDLGKVVTMHANCCKGLHAKITDLTAFLDGWKEHRNQFLVKVRENLHGSDLAIRTPKECPKSWT